MNRSGKRFGKRTVEPYLHRPRHELHDVQADPGEMHNLTAASEHAATLASLRGELERLRGAMQ